jgi:hypothetical protein
MAAFFFYLFIIILGFFINTLCILFWIDVGENFEEPKDLMTFISEEELNDEEENVVLPVVLKDDEKVEEPKASMTFSSIEEVCSYYWRYAKQVGFGIAHRSSRKKKGIKSYVVLICTCGGPSDCAKPTPATNGTGCGAKICANLCDDGTCFLSKVELTHNHSLSPGKVRFFRSNKKINDAAKRRLELNDRAGIRLSKNFNSLVVESGGFESLSFGEMISAECYTFKPLNLHMLSSSFCYSLMFCVVFVFSCILQILEENPSNSKIRTKSANSLLDRFNSNQF